MEPFTKILEFAAKYAWAVFVLAAFVLFMPDDAATQLGIEPIKTSYKGYFWLTLVFTGTLSLGAAFSYLDRKVFDGWLQDRRARACKNFCVNGHLAGNCHASRSNDDRSKESRTQRAAG
jgi:hypothetical protein